MNDDILKSFLSYLAVEKGQSENTLQSYQRDLNRYLRFMKGKNADDLRKSDIVSFLARLSSTGISPASAARSLAAIRGFHK